MIKDRKEVVTLRCLSCGRIIGVGRWDAAQAEEWAQWTRENDPHECPPPAVDHEAVRSAMYRFRANSEPLDFETEMKVYNFIMANQTYL